ncbi:MAG: hypothetical protein PHQ87_15845, partial [Hydrogenophaga sp.]|nr:hypothetical protein [Hydrogenophaga sp.]
MTALIARLKETLASLFPGAELPGLGGLVGLNELRALTGRSGFKALPHGRWVAWWSNNFEDRQKEWFPEHAIDAYVARLDAGAIPQPELWLWHEPVVLGQAEWTERIGHLVVSVGHFASSDVGVRACAYFSSTDDEYAMSHCYLFPPKAFKDGQYHAFNTFEITVLPPHAAANPYTAFESVYEEVGKMALTEEKKALLDRVLGKELADSIVAGADQRSKELEALGVRFKDFGGAEDSTGKGGEAETPAAAATPATPAPADEPPAVPTEPAAVATESKPEVKEAKAEATPAAPVVAGAVDADARAAIKALAESSAASAAALNAVLSKLDALETR